MLAKHALVALVLAVALHGSAMADDLCCDFVRESVSFQKELARKVKELNARPVYLFDATGFSASFTDVVTPMNVRYKTGIVNGTLVDAVLSVSAQRTLGGQAGSQTFYTWAGRDPLLVVDDHGVRL
jgi:hypothetical protein